MKTKLIAALVVLPLALPAQEAFFPKPQYFRQSFVQPQTRVELLTPAKLSDYVVAGKLELSLRAYLELVMANNTDIAISKLAVETATNAITRGHSVFDPRLTANFNSTRTKQLPTDVLAGAAVVQTLSQPLNINYTQQLTNGTTLNIGFSEQKFTTNSRNAIFNPAFNNSLNVNFAQPLLRNRGGYIARLPIMFAQSRLRKSEHDLKAQLIQLISTAELAYWQGVQLREQLRVQENNLDVADQFLQRSRRELELGAISKLDIFQPEQQYVQAQAAVAQIRYQILQQDDILRRQIGADLEPNIRTLPIVLTETPSVPATNGQIEPEALIAKAMSMRPDLMSAKQDLDIDELSIKQATNALRPDLSLTATYTTQGRGGTAFTRTNVFNDDLGTESTITQIIPGGYGDAWSQMWGFNYPVYGFGLRLQLPIKNRAASADLADALVNKKRDAYQVRAAEQQIRQEVLIAMNQVEQSKTNYDLAVRVRDFARQRLDAENKKYELGTGTQFIVLDAQQRLTEAEGNVVQQAVNYQRNALALQRATGDLLEARGVAIK
jgi:outer membrane protein